MQRPEEVVNQRISPHVGERAWVVSSPEQPSFARRNAPNALLITLPWVVWSVQHVELVYYSLVSYVPFCVVRSAGVNDCILLSTQASPLSRRNADMWFCRSRKLFMIARDRVFLFASIFVE